MTEGGWASPPDPTRDRHSAFAEPGRPSSSPLPTVGPPPSYLLLGVLTTVFCFLPFGIVSIVKGSSVAPLWAQGRYAEARRASRAARNWAIAAVVVLPVLVVLVLMALVTVFAVALK